MTGRQARTLALGLACVLIGGTFIRSETLRVVGAVLLLLGLVFFWRYE